MTPASDRPGLDHHGDTPVEIARLQTEIMARLGPEHRTREAIRMSRALLRQRQATLLEECHGDRDRMLERLVESNHGPAIARAFAACRRQQR